MATDCVSEHYGVPNNNVGLGFLSDLHCDDAAAGLCAKYNLYFMLLITLVHDNFLRSVNRKVIYYNF